MRNIKIGLVAEGPSDCVVISELLGKYLRNVCPEDVQITFKNFQPYVDNTSKSGYSEGGWSMVYKWCLANPPEERVSSYFSEGLFADDMDEFHCSGIVVHMDSDICEEIRDKSPVLPIPEAASSSLVRGKFIYEVLLNWLWPDHPVNDPRYIIAPAVESTEAWLVAGLSDDAEVEANLDIQKRLAELDYVVVRGRPAPPNIKKPNKTVRNFENICSVASVNIERIFANCAHFQSAANQLGLLVQRELALEKRPAQEGVAFFA